MAGLAAGADGLMLEVHPKPDNALSDGYQTITPGELRHITRRAALLAEALDGFDEADTLLELSPLNKIEETSLEAIA
jgi:3-deoxy-D-manno-octulosonic acid (KDO) 8-phosphate synthase